MSVSRYAAMVTSNDGADEADQQELAAGHDAFPARIAETSADPQTPDDAACRDHLTHQEWIRNLIAGRIGDRVVVQYVVTD